MGNLYEVHEYTAGRYAWHVWDEETGAVVAAFNDGQRVVEEGEELAGGAIAAEATLTINGVPFASALPRTELAAYQAAIAAAGPGARCNTVFTGGHPDPAIRALIEG